MSAAILDGAAAARTLAARTGERVAALLADGIVPRLAVVLVGNDPASQVYVRNKTAACAQAGVAAENITMPDSAETDAIVAAVARLNRAPDVHGILVQLPLPAHVDKARIVAAIAPEKDVDGFGPAHLGALVSGRAGLPPCTPAGIMALLDRHGIAIEGRHVVVIGRSNIVGKPAALMLLARGATVTVCTSRTVGLAEHTRRADILVVAAGRPGLVTADMVRPGAAVIDVGIHRLPDGRLTGDVDFAGVSKIAGHITPVPGGVGPMTVACLVANTVTAAERVRARRLLPTA